MNGTNKSLAAIGGIVTIIGVSIYLYFAYLNPEVAFLSSGGLLFGLVFKMTLGNW